MTILFLGTYPSDGVPRTTPFGAAGILHENAGRLWLGRAPGADPRAVIWAAKEQGAEYLVSVEDVVGLNRLLRAGDWLVPDDYIEQTKGQPTTFFRSRGMGFLQQSPAFAEPLRAVLVATLGVTGGSRSFNLGTYLAQNGPRRPTPGEARVGRGWGADIVGHFALPEATLARELEMGYAILAHVATTVPTRPDAPLPPWQPAASEWVQQLTAAVTDTTLPALTGSNEMARRLVGADWREWVG